MKKYLFLLFIIGLSLNACSEDKDMYQIADENISIYSPRKDKLFKKLESDMYNLAPATGEVNADRSNYRFNAARTDEELKGQYGACEFKVNFKEKKAYPSSKSRGEIARAYLYMNKKYGIQLSKTQLKLYQSWNKMYPVSDWEKLRAKRISKLQKNKKSFIQ